MLWSTVLVDGAVETDELSTRLTVEVEQGRTLVVSSLPGNPPWQSDSALS